MTTTVEAPPNIAPKDIAVSTPDDTPMELVGKTSAEMSAQTALRAQLDVARSRRVGAREELDAAKARVGRKVPVNDDGRIVDENDRAIVGYQYLGTKSAGVVDAQARIDQVEGEIRELEAQIWDVDATVLERARADAEAREARPSADLRTEIDRIEKDRGRRREALAESEALLAAAKRERDDLYDRSTRGGETTLAKDITKLEDLVSLRESQVRARGVAFQRTLDETEPPLRQFQSGLDVAEQRERDEQDAEEQRARASRIAVQIRRQAHALADLTQAEAELAAENAVIIHFASEIGHSADLFATAVGQSHGIRLIRPSGYWELVETPPDASDPDA